MPTSLNGVIDNTSIKIGKTLNLFASSEHAIAGTPVVGTVPPQIAYASNNYGTFSVQSAYWPALSIKFNQVGQNGYWASGWINTANNLPLADPSTVTLGAIQLADAAMTLPLTVTPQSTGVVHDVAVSVWNGSTWAAIKSWSGVAASTTWSLTQTNVRSMLTIFNGAGPYRVRVVVVTKKDGTTVGTSTKEVSATMASSLAPSVGGYQLTDAHPAAAALNLGSVGATKYFVQGLSIPKITLTGGVYPAYGAYLSKIEVKQDNKVIYTSTRPANDSGTSDPIEFYVSQDPNKTGSVAISVSVIDTRGVTSSGALAANLLPYSAPTLTNLQVRRASDTSGTLDEAGTYIRIDGYTNRSALTVNSVDKNSATLKIYVKEKSVAEFSETPFDSKAVAAGSTSQSYTITTAIDANKSYDVLVVLADGLNQTGQTLTLATQKVPFSIGKDEGIGVGKIWEAGALDISSSGGIAIDGVLKSPWPWLSEIGTVQATDDFNDLDDGYYLHIGFGADNAPMLGGLVLVNTVDNYKAQVVFGAGEIQWRIFNGSTWLPWNIAMDGSTSIDNLASWYQDEQNNNFNQLTMTVNNLAGSDYFGPPKLVFVCSEYPNRKIYIGTLKGAVGVDDAGPYFQDSTLSKIILLRDNLRLVAGSVPATSTSTGEKGDVAYDASHMYVCTATNTWKRIPWGTW